MPGSTLPPPGAARPSDGIRGAGREGRRCAATPRRGAGPGPAHDESLPGGPAVFVAVRDIRFAKGRFALMGSVVALITLLVVLLSGLTAGLADESVSAIDRLPATRIAFGAAGDADPEESFADSSVTAEQLRSWSGTDGVAWAEALAVTPARLELSDGSAAATVLAAEPGGRLAPEGTGDGALVVSEPLAEEEGLAA